MGILSRFRDIMASNVNAWLDKTEDPAKAIDDYMRNLYSDLGKVKAETGALLTDERRAQRALEDCRGEIDKLQRYAEKAVEAGDDGDARNFLDKKAAQAAKRDQLQTAYELAASNAAHMKQMQDKLVSDIGKLEARRVELKGKMAAAQAQQKVNAVGSASSGTQDSVFGAMEEKVNKAYNEAMAIAELREEPKDDLDDLFAQLEKGTDASAEDELAAIKAKLNKK
ncbi:PspA/IM30 family protein [Paenibacillaceae bacterium]|nr:PspA/IM30 family protein [Paenibacillaceae bacterium]